MAVRTDGSNPSRSATNLVSETTKKLDLRRAGFARELAFERLTSNVRQAVQNYGIRYSVAVDTKSTIWNSFSKEFWPSNYFADTRGRLRYHHFGEGDYRHQEEQEEVIRELLREAGADNPPDGYVCVEGDRERFAVGDPRP